MSGIYTRRIGKLFGREVGVASWAGHRWRGVRARTLREVGYFVLELDIGWRFVDIWVGPSAEGLDGFPEDEIL